LCDAPQGETMKNIYFDQKVLGDMQFPLQKLMDLNVKTMQTMSFLKPGDLMNVKKPGDVFERNMSMFIRNTNLALNYMRDTFSILENHWLGIAPFSQEHPLQQVTSLAKKTLKRSTSSAKKAVKKAVKKSSSRSKLTAKSASKSTSKAKPKTAVKKAAKKSTKAATKVVKLAKSKASKAKASKAKASKAKVAKAKVAKPKVAKAKVAKAKASKAKVSKAKVSKAKVSKAKVAKPLKALKSVKSKSTFKPTQSKFASTSSPVKQEVRAFGDKSHSLGSSSKLSGMPEKSSIKDLGLLNKRPNFPS
jgi:hypothetical protein